MNTQVTTNDGPGAKRERRILNVRAARAMLLEEAANWGAPRTRVPRGALARLEADARKLVAVHAAQFDPARKV